MMTHKQRMLAAFRGEQVDRLPFAPRLELWYLANSTSGTLPKQYAGRAMNEIARAEGWTVYFRFADDQLDPVVQPMYLHRGIGLFGSRDTVYDFVMPSDVEIKVRHDGSYKRLEYHTPLGMVSTTVQYDIETQKRGITIPAVVDHLIKTPDDYAPAGYLFEHIRIVPNSERYVRWAKDEIRDDGVAVCHGFAATSPIHEIQRDLIDPTQFFLHYDDHQEKMRGLAERMEHLFNGALDIICKSPAEVVLWGSNYDDMLTYPPYFEREILPWIRKVAGRLADAGKLLLCHTDGENEGLMDLIRELGHAHRQIDLPGTDDARFAGGILSALESSDHAVRRHSLDHPAAGDLRRRVRGVHGRTVPRRRSGNAHCRRSCRQRAARCHLLASATDRRADRAGRRVAAQGPCRRSGRRGAGDVAAA